MTSEPFDRAEHCRRIAADGGNATLRIHGRWHYVIAGKAGRAATIERHGLGYWRGIATAKGWTAPRRPDLERDLIAGRDCAELTTE